MVVKLAPNPSLAAQVAIAIKAAGAMAKNGRSIERVVVYISRWYIMLDLIVTLRCSIFWI